MRYPLVLALTLGSTTEAQFLKQYVVDQLGKGDVQR